MTHKRTAVVRLLLCTGMWVHGARLFCFGRIGKTTLFWLILDVCGSTVHGTVFIPESESYRLAF